MTTFSAVQVLRTPTHHLLSIADLAPEAITEVLDEAADLRADAVGTPMPATQLEGRAVGLIFDKPSLRTRVSFEVGIARLGGTAVSLDAREIGLGTREPARDVGRSLARYVDAIVGRIHDDETLRELAAFSGVPVVNALSASEHPCQALADLLTLRDELGSLAGHQLVFIGDGNNVAHSLLLAGASVGLHVRVATPHGYEPDAAIVDEARDLARASGARIELTHDPLGAVDGADAVYTDVWTSMGAEHEAAARRIAFARFRLTSDLLRGAPDALVMHCLPAHRGEEIDADVLESPHSVAFDQVENRLYVQQAVLLWLLRHSRAAGRRGRTSTPTSAEVRARF